MTEPMAESSALARPATDVFAPTAFEYLFWRPRHLLDTPVVEHMPLLFWVYAALRPRDVAVVGDSHGVAHFALCQAIDKLNDPGRCVGYGFWADTKTGKAQIPEQLSAHQEMLYEDISQLVTGQDLDVIADDLQQRALDLLWLDLETAPEGLCQKAELLARSLKPGGVMFVHAITHAPADGPDFAALQRLMKSNPCVRFDGETGLLLIVPDGETSPRLQALISASKGSVLTPEVQKIFRRVGQGLLSTVRSTSARKALQNADKRVTDAVADRDAAKAALQELNTAYDLRNQKIAEMQSKLHDSRLHVTDLETKLKLSNSEQVASRLAQEKARAENEKLQGKIAANKAALDAALASEKNTRLKETAALASEKNARFTETAALTKMAEELRTEVAALTARNQDLAADAKVNQKRAARERRTRFEETAALTRVIEGLKVERARSKRPLEVWLIEKLVRSKKKKQKYQENRKAFFMDSRSVLARAYFRMRPHP